MRCPFCGIEDTQVKDSRPSTDGISIRRRRYCTQCDSRFTTFERVQFRELTVIKNNGEKEVFDRDKMTRSIMMALRKRSIDSEQVDQIVTNIERNLEGMGENEVPTRLIGELVMNALSNLDQVAYVRFASVYKQFREAKDFDDFIKELNKLHNK